MKFNFDKKTNNFLKIILKNAQSQNLRVFFVGGIVRDKILNIPTFDIDLLLLGNAIDFAKTLPDEIKIKSIHKDFCTVKIEFNGIEIDIASSRAELYPHSGCLPVIDKIGVNLERDALRRDFSINSLYCELKLKNNEINYNLIDMINGIEDLKNKTLKVLHQYSYIDDPTRILRGVGFKYRFGFDFSEYDNRLIREYLNKIKYENMSIDRNKKVLKKVLNSKFQIEIFKEIIEKKYYKIITQNEVSVDFELINKIFNIFSLDMISMSELYLKIIQNPQIELLHFEKLSEIHKTFSKIDYIDLAYYYYKTKDENTLKYLSFKDIHLEVSGDDLIKLGFKQGKLLGKILDEILNEKLKSPKNYRTKQQEINWILKHFPKN